MKTLSFLGIFREKILKGEKNITIRVGKIDKYKEGDLVKIDCGGKILAIARIERVYYKKLKDLEEEEIKRDGFKNLEEFVKNLRKMYKIPISEDLDLTIIEFKILQRIDEEQYNYVYKGYDLIELAERGLNLDELSEEEKKILKRFLELKSIRAVAIELGGLNKRWIVRKVLRKVLKILNREKKA